MQEFTRKNSKIILSYALFALILIYIFKYTSFDIHKFTLISLWDFLLLSIWSIVLLIFNGVTLKLSMEAFKGGISFNEAFYISQYFSLFNYLPLKAGIIAEGAYLKLKHNFPINKYISGTILVYLANFLIYFLAGIALVLFFDFSRIFQIIRPLYLILFLVAVLILILVYLFFPESIKNKHKYFEYLERLFQSRKDFLESGRYIFCLVVASAAILIVTTARLSTIFGVLNYQISFPIVLALAILTGFSFTVSFTPGNLIVREAFLGSLTYIIMSDANIGIIASMFMRLFDLFWLVIFGAVAFFKLKITFSREIENV